MNRVLIFIEHVFSKSISNCCSWSSGSWWGRHPDHHLLAQSRWISASWTWIIWFEAQTLSTIKTYLMNTEESVRKIKHLVTSSTWWAQALFLRMGASPCQITRMCCGKTNISLSRHLDQNLLRSVRFSKYLKVIYFSPFWRLHPDQPVLDATAVEAGDQAVKVALGQTKCQVRSIMRLQCKMPHSKGILLKTMDFKMIFTSSSSSTSRVLLIPESA